MHDNRSRTGASVRPRVTSFVAGALLAAGTMLAAPAAFAQARPPLPPGARGAGAPDSMTPRPAQVPRGAMMPDAGRRGARQAPRRGARPDMGPGMGQGMRPGTRPGMGPQMGPPMGPGMGRGVPPGVRPGMPPGLRRDMGPGMQPGPGPGRRQPNPRRNGEPGAPRRDRGPRAGRGGAAVQGNPAQGMLRMRERLALTDEQVRRLESLAGASRTSRESDLLRARADLMDAMRGEGDIDRARTALERMSRVRNEQTLAGIRARQEARRVLTDAQRRQIDEARGGRGGRGERGARAGAAGARRR